MLPNGTTAPPLIEFVSLHLCGGINKSQAVFIILTRTYLRYLSPPRVTIYAIPEGPETPLVLLETARLRP